MDQKQLDHHANLHNPDSIAHKHALDNRSRQKNAQDPAYAKSRAAPLPEARRKK